MWLLRTCTAVSSRLMPWSKRSNSVLKYLRFTSKSSTLVWSTKTENGPSARWAVVCLKIWFRTVLCFSAKLRNLRWSAGTWARARASPLWSKSMWGVTGMLEVLESVSVPSRIVVWLVDAEADSVSWPEVGFSVDPCWESAPKRKPQQQAEIILINVN